MSRNRGDRLLFWRQLWGAQAAALAATGIDFTVLIVCVEVFGIPYQIGTGIGATVGAVSNFLMGRHWIFRATSGDVRGQAIRYAIAASCSLVLNWSGVVGLTESIHTPYWVSRVIIAAVVAIFFNFPMQRWFVFRYHREENQTPLPDSVQNG